MSGFHFKIADSEGEFEAIHVLNYRTFVEEIPQHPANPQGRLVDSFHEQNTYAICLDGDRVVGMLAGRHERPFSLDRKLPGLDGYLPVHHKPVELRLLAVEPAYRKSAIFTRLMATLAGRFTGNGYDLALISGTLRQRKLYAHLGFTPFGPTLGTAEAPFQPMFLDLAAYNRLVPRLARVNAPRTAINLLPGPVCISGAVENAFRNPAISHRGPDFLRMHRETRSALCTLTGCTEAFLLGGSGTLANDAVAAQIGRWPGKGLVLANGEFGDRLLDHAGRWGLRFEAMRQTWGSTFDLRAVDHAMAADADIRWLWAVASETSTGVRNPAGRLAELCAARGVDLCLDAISAVGCMPIALDAVRLASCVSSKGLGSYAGLAIVLSNGPVVDAGQLPRYLDLALYRAADGVPFTLSSNLLAALHTALIRTDWADRHARTRMCTEHLRRELRALGFVIVAGEPVAAPGVVTIALPATTNSHRLCARMKRVGYTLAHESAYLATRNWMQVCLMGDFPQGELRSLPHHLALQAGT